MRTDLLRIPCRTLAAAAALAAATAAHAQPLVAPGDPAAAATTATPVVPAPTPAPPMAVPPATDPAAAATVAPPTAPPAAAASAPAVPARLRPLRFVANVGYDYGFEELVTAERENGSDERLPANGGGVLSVGLGYLPLGSDTLELRATIGVKYSAITASNGEIYYVAFPAELLAGYTIQRFKLSAGASYSLSPRVRGKEFFEGQDADFESSLGFVGQVEYVFPFRGGGGFFNVGLRFLLQRLELEKDQGLVFKDGGTSIDANALGIVAGVSL